jgi:hypothetical protein
VSCVSDSFSPQFGSKLRGNPLGLPADLFCFIDPVYRDNYVIAGIWPSVEASGGRVIAINTRIFWYAIFVFCLFLLLIRIKRIFIKSKVTIPVEFIASRRCSAAYTSVTLGDRQDFHGLLSTVDVEVRTPPGLIGFWIF